MLSTRERQEMECNWTYSACSHNGSECPPYCNCDFSLLLPITSCDQQPEFPSCRCGEDISGNTKLDWVWEEYSDSDVKIHGQNVIFHPVYSQGTAIVRGNKPLQPNMVHFWEIRVLTVMSGTEVMFGIGTDEVNLSEYNYHFVSALGWNNQSWGFSYTGKIQHAGVQIPYGQRFSKGCIIGIYLDRVLGYMEYYINRRPLGIAFTGISNNEILYPMVCSTTAKSAIRLINSLSVKESLQFRAFSALTKQPNQLQALSSIPGLKRIVDQYSFLTPSLTYSEHNRVQKEEDIRNEALLTPVQSTSNNFLDDEMEDQAMESDVSDNNTGFFCERKVGNVYTVRPIRLGASSSYAYAENDSSSSDECYDEYYNSTQKVYSMKR